MSNVFFFVKTELLLNEFSFDIMKNFFSQVNDNSIFQANNTYNLVYDATESKGVCIGPLKSDLIRPGTINLIHQQLASGYILMSLDELKKFLTCE